MKFFGTVHGLFTEYRILSDMMVSSKDLEVLFNMTKKKILAGGALLLAMILTVAMAVSAMATGTELVIDTNPAIAVAKNTANSVVGVITNAQSWNRQNGETIEQMIGQGSGVVIREGGYVLTNYHVIESGSSYQLILPSGEKADAKLIGSDESTDLAILQVETDESLVPCAIGYASEMPVGSTVIAIGNPGGEILANSVTAGVISAVERDVPTSGATRKVLYIQHDAAISSGNSGGGLFDVNSRLLGINTLKYAGNSYANMLSGSVYEGLGFAIPMDVAEKIATDLIDHGKVIRPQLGVQVYSWYGPDVPLNSDPPASVMVGGFSVGGAAEESGMKMGDFITEINGVRVKTLPEMTAELDKCAEGDTVKVTVIRYGNVSSILAQAGIGATEQIPADGSEDQQGGTYDPFSDFFGGENPFGNQNPYGNRRQARQSLGGFEEMQFDVQLRVLN